MDTLSLFNQQVLQCQDDAYTLAWYLLDDEVEAEVVMQKAVEAAYHCFSIHKNDCHLLILKQIVNKSQERRSSTYISLASRLPYNLHFLDQSEQLTLVLIDILGLEYNDAANIMDRPVQDIRQLIARARRRVANPKELPTP